MIEVPMNDDIRKYQPKVLGPFNLRQLLCMILAITVAIPLWRFINMEVDDKVLLMCVILLPILACGWIKMDGLPFEKLLIRMVYFYLLAPKRRKYISENTYKQALLKNKPPKPKKKNVEYSSKLKVYS